MNRTLKIVLAIIAFTVAVLGAAWAWLYHNIRPL